MTRGPSNGDRIWVGCQSFPVSRDRYAQTCGFIEISETLFPSRVSTLHEWAKLRSEGFQFTVRLTATPTRSSRSAWRTKVQKAKPARTSLQDVVSALSPRVVVLSLPKEAPTPDALRQVEEKARQVTAEGRLLFLEPARSWAGSLLDQLCQRLRCFVAEDPFSPSITTHQPVHYLRVRGSGRESLHDAQIGRLKERCRGKHNFVLLEKGGHAWANATALARSINGRS